MKEILLAASLLLTSTSISFGSSIALDSADDAAYDPSDWADGTNGGSGFSAWSLTTSGNAGLFIGDSNTNGTGQNSGGIDSSNQAFGAFAFPGGFARASRDFTGGPLVIGQTFSVDFDNGNIDNFAEVSVALRNNLGERLLEFAFIGGQTKYSIRNATVTSGELPNFTDDGMSIAFTLTDPDSYLLEIVTFENGNTATIMGDLASPSGGQGVSQFYFANSGSGGTFQVNDAFVNNLSISAVPEPLMALGGGGLLCLVGLRRRQGAF